VSLQEQLKEAQQKIEEQAAHNAKREEEQVRAVAEQKDKLSTWPWWKSICAKLIQPFSTLWLLNHLKQP